MHMLVPHVGWLADLTKWLRELADKAFTEAMQFFADQLELLFSHGVDIFLAVINAIPVPTFFQGISLCSILSQAGPLVGWATMTMQLPAGVALISAAFVFRMTRKALTLFQW